MNARKALSYYPVAPYYFLANYVPAVRNAGTKTVDICTRLLNAAPTIFNEQK